MTSIISTIPLSRRPEPSSHTSWCDRTEHEQQGGLCISADLDTPGGGVFATECSSGTRIVLIDPPREGMTTASARLLIVALQQLIDAVEQDHSGRSGHGGASRLLNDQRWPREGA